MTPCVEWTHKIKFYDCPILSTSYLQICGILLVELNWTTGVFREHINSAGGQVIIVPSLSVSVAPS